MSIRSKKRRRGYKLYSTSVAASSTKNKVVKPSTKKINPRTKSK